MEGEGKTPQERTYWNNFHIIRFNQILGTDFSTQLEIPNKFYQNLIVKLPSKVTLKGPSGATWNVHLATKNDTLFFRDGWEAFVRAYSLNENDTLTFNYNKGNSCFDVFMYDGKSKCEKEMSYFVENENNTIGFGSSPIYAAKLASTTPQNIIIDNKRKMTRRESISRSGAADAAEPTTTTMKKKKKSAARRSVDVGECSKRKPKFVISSDEEDDVEEEEEDCDHSDCDSDRTWRINGVRRSTGARRRHYFSAGFKEPSLSDVRKPATEEQKKKAIATAKKSASSTASFYVVITTSHERLCIPAKWATKHLDEVHQYLFLQYKGKKYCIRYNSRGCGGVIVSGWKQFISENYIQRHDVCVFKFNPEKHQDCVVVDVSIHYAGSWSGAE